MFLIISTSTNKKSVADVISKNLLDNKLTPCTNISSKSMSTYIWQNKMIKDDEYILSIKTIDSFKEDVVKIIKDNHNYDVPEIISTQIEILSNDYKKWFKDNLNT